MNINMKHVQREQTDNGCIDIAITQSTQWIHIKSKKISNLNKFVRYKVNQNKKQKDEVKEISSFIQQAPNRS